MKQLTAVLVGAGNRGQIYADYSLSNPDELKMIAAVDPHPLRKAEVKEKYNLPKNRLFDSVDEFLSAGISCDFVINGTMDSLHYETAKALILAGYNLVLEKPITAKVEELLDLQRLAKEKGVKVIICHVLRYTPFYRTIKEIILSGDIGEIITMEMNEHVGILHFLDSYVRGKWNSEKGCGSGFLLAKSCHDTDLMCWLNGSTTPKKVYSFGSRSLFIKEKAPEGATEFCYTCPHVKTCMYSAQLAHLEQDTMPFQTWVRIGKPIEEITKEEKAEFLKTDVYGKCAYNSGGDIVDRQMVTVEFENGSLATLTMLGGASRAGRWLHIVGTKGEIVGYVEEAKLKVTRFTLGEGIYDSVDEVIDVSSQIISNALYSGHAGGDYALMHDVVRSFAGEGDSVSVTRLDDSVNGHLIAYAAEESRKTNQPINIKDVK